MMFGESNSRHSFHIKLQNISIYSLWEKLLSYSHCWIYGYLKVHKKLTHVNSRREEIKDINKTSLFIRILSAHLLNLPPKPKYDFLCTSVFELFSIHLLATCIWPIIESHI